MMIRIGTAAVLLAATMAFGQTSSPMAVPGGGPIATQGQMLSARKAMPSMPGKPPGAMQPTPLPKRIDDMQATLTQMHAVLKRMQANAAKSQTKDSAAKANLEMWGLLVGHLESQLKELRLAQAMHEDMEARRAALYKQADAKADAERQAAIAARGFGGGQTSTPSPATPGAVQSTTGQAPSPQAPAQAPASSSPSPN